MSIYLIDKNSTEFSKDELEVLKNDSSINGKKAFSFDDVIRLTKEDFNRLFLTKYDIDYISEYFISKDHNFRIVSHPYETDTCFEKAELLNSWNPLNVIKALYFEYSVDHSLYAVVVPETGCFINKKRLKEELKLPGNGFLKKARNLPKHMTYGTCSPFISRNNTAENEIEIKKIIFDSETLKAKKDEKSLDDFSFGIDHRFSIQMNYYNCYNMLKKLFPSIITKKSILTLSFKENFVRTKGRIKISYDFESINYNTAKFINSIHGYGDVSIINDYVDELDMPNVLIKSESVSDININN